MSKPWDKEPTPLVDAIWVSDMPDEKAIDEVCDLAVQLERRMRAAERLLMSAWKQNNNASIWEELDDEVIKHLEAAREEDGR